MTHCSRCGTAVDRTDAYCAGCGEQLSDGRSPTGPDGPSSDRQGRGSDASPTPGAADDSRPGGLELVCGILAILGVTSAVGGLTLAQSRAAFGGVVGGTVGSGGNPPLFGLLALALGCGYLAAAYGLWHATDWAWQATIGALAVGTVYHLAGPGSPGTAVFAALASGGLCAYLLTSGERFRPAVQSAPGGAAGETG